MKALYLYLTAEYSTANNVLNEMVLWDKIVMNGEKMELDMKSAKVQSQIINRNSNNHVDIRTQFILSFYHCYLTWISPDQILLQKWRERLNRPREYNINSELERDAQHGRLEVEEGGIHSQLQTANRILRNHEERTLA